MPARIRASLVLCLGILLTRLWIMPAPASDLARSYTGKGLSPALLRCEYKVNPLGIDEPAPRLSWEVQSGQRVQRQTAYRVLVASNQQLLRDGFGDLWDSALVPSDETTCIPYKGKPLQSNQRCYWKVKVWDKN